MGGAAIRVGVAAGTSASEFATIFERQNGCFKCEGGSPTCPTCLTGEECRLTPQSCQECSKAYCAKATETAAVTPVQSSVPSSGPSIGPIAGGVIGGLSGIAIITYLVWRFFIKNKRGEYKQEAWDGSSTQAKESAAADFESRRSQRQSTHSVHSMASTVLTRASNIIQIAYIPGVTNRATPTSPTLLVPPVPPIPLALSDAGSPSPYEDQHFFVPGALRDSTYSGISNYSDRTSYARTSYAPRSSVASTIYGKNAVVGPVQKGTLLKPSLVSVKSKAPSMSSSGLATPPVPAVDYNKYDQPPPSPAFSIGATFLKKASASTATSVRPQVVRVGTSPRIVETRSSASSISTDDEPETYDPEPLVQVRESRTVRDSNAITIIDDTPTVDQGPFSDPPIRSTARKSSSSLGAVIEEATRRAAETNHSNANTSDRGRSPFGDEHAYRD